ncbi:MAG TPA: malonic semialdehyde reductase [Dongiaceae bacterium]|jgi:3-hydroxypropanoate dehydrogenase
MPDSPVSPEHLPPEHLPVDRQALEQIFLEAHTTRRWAERGVPDDLLARCYDLAKMAPTSANCQPLRILFVRSADAKERLKPALSPGNVTQTMAAPVTAVFAADMEFHEHLPRLYPGADARSWYAGKPEAIRGGAELNAALQVGYFILAARALGLSCGPMGGFDRAKVDQAFFAEAGWGRTWRSQVLCNLGYPGPDGTRPRDPRFRFDEACRIA